jgi:hypothetical protein
VVLLSLPCQLGESFVERVGAHLRRLEQRCRVHLRQRCLPLRHLFHLARALLRRGIGSAALRRRLRRAQLLVTSEHCRIESVEQACCLVVDEEHLSTPWMERASEGLGFRLQLLLCALSAPLLRWRKRRCCCCTMARAPPERNGVLDLAQIILAHLVQFDRRRSLWPVAVSIGYDILADIRDLELRDAATCLEVNSGRPG